MSPGYGGKNKMEGYVRVDLLDSFDIGFRGHFGLHSQL